MTQGAPQGASLGTAKGIIEIDISSVEQAARRVLQLSQQISVGLAGIGKGGAQGIQAAMQQAVRAQTATITQLLKTQREASEQTLRAVQQTSQQVTDNIQQAAQKAAQAVQNVQQQSNRRAPAPRPQQQGGFGQGNPNIPTFAQFGLFPFAGLAGSLGASGLQQGILGASSLLGIAEIGSTRNAIVRLADQLKGLDGVFGSLANAGANVATRLGASAGGLLASISSIALAAAPLAIGLAAVALVFGQITAGAEESEEKIQGMANAIIELNKQIAAGATTEDVQEQVDAAERERGGLEGRRSEIADILSQFDVFASDEERARLNQRISAATNGQITNLEGGDLFTPSGFEQAQALLGQFDERISDLNATIIEGTSAIESGQTRANDFAEAMDLVAKAQADAAEAARGLTNAEIGDIIHDLQKDYDGVFAIINSGLPISAAYRKELNQQANELNASIAAYKQLQNPLRDFRIHLENLPEALAETGKAINQLREDFGRDQARTLQDRQRAAEREEAEFLRQRQRRLEDFQREQETSDADYARDRARRIEDFEREQAELEAEAVEARADALEEFNREERRREEDHQIQMARTVRDGRISQLEAAARLDARALFETQRRTRIQLSDQQEDFERERARRLEDFELQNEDLEENLEEQRRKRREDFERQLADQDRQFAIQRQRRLEDFIRQQQQEEADRALRLRRQAEDYALQDQRRLEDLNRRIAQQIQSDEAIQGIVQGGLNSIQFIWQYAMNAMVSQTQGAANALSQLQAIGTSGGSGGGSGVFDVRTFHEGTPNVRGSGLANLLDGEAVLDRGTAGLYRQMLRNNTSQADATRVITGRGAVGNVSFSVGNVTIQGGIGNRTDADVRALLRNAFSEWWSEELMEFMTGTAADLEIMHG